ncbi:MAG: DUF1836 domain-containing protein [Bacilli bacterium]|nr:DUF1836 domain-containing protein [Bacilli bacterium]
MARDTAELEKWIKEVSSFELPQFNELPNVDLFMEQVLSYINSSLAIFSDDPRKILTSFMVNNYVKAGMIREPQKKKYDREQLGYLMAITLMKQTLSMSNMAILLGLDRYATPDKRRLYSFYRSLEMSTMKNQASNLEKHIADAVKRYEREKQEGKLSRQEIENNLNGALGLFALRLATQAQVDKILADHLINEIRKRLFDESEIARQDKPLTQEAEREAKGGVFEAREIKRAKMVKAKKDSLKNYLED